MCVCVCVWNGFLKINKKSSHFWNMCTAFPLSLYFANSVHFVWARMEPLVNMGHVVVLIIIRIACFCFTLSPIATYLTHRRMHKERNSFYSYRGKFKSYLFTCVYSIYMHYFKYLHIHINISKFSLSLSRYILAS